MKHNCKECAKTSKYYAERSKYYAEKCRCKDKLSSDNMEEKNEGFD